MRTVLRWSKIENFSADLSWTANTTAVIKKAWQRLHFLRLLRKNNMGEKLLVNLYHSSIESVLTYYIIVRYACCFEADTRRLQRIIYMAQRIIGCPLPSLKDRYNSSCLSKFKNILKDSSHLRFKFF